MQRYLTCALGAATLMGFGCDRRDEIQTYTIPKTLAIASEAAPDSADTTNAPKWTVPDGWTFVPGKEMRFASFKVSAEHPDVELSIVPLAGTAGSLMENVNRWRKQLGLPPTEPKDLQNIMTSGDLSGTPVGLFDMNGPTPTDGKPQQRLLAAIVPQPTQTWFFKLVGPVDVVTAQKANFDSFIHSLKFPAAGPDATAQGPDVAPPGPATPTPAGPPAPETAGPAQSLPITFTIPAGWSQQTTQNQFRVVGFDILDGNQSAVATVSRMPENSGSVLDNINRWRGQVNLPAVDDPSQSKPDAVKIAGLDGQLWDFQGAAAGDQPAGRIVVAMLTRGSTWWFFKVQGPVPMVAAQRDAFLKFLNSVQFQGDAQ
jgi:hypothetical protein